MTKKNKTPVKRKPTDWKARYAKADQRRRNAEAVVTEIADNAGKFAEENSKLIRDLKLIAEKNRFLESQRSQLLESVGGLNAELREAQQRFDHLEAIVAVVNDEKNLVEQQLKKQVAYSYDLTRDFQSNLTELENIRNTLAELLGVELDAEESAGPQSADRQSLNLGAPMTTQQIIAEVVRILSMIAALTPFKYDDTAVAFVIWAQDQEWFIALVERIRPASSSEELEAQSLMFEPEALEALQLFGRESGRQMTGKYGELLSLIFQIIAWVKAHQAS